MFVRKIGQALYASCLMEVDMYHALDALDLLR